METLSFTGTGNEHISSGKLRIGFLVSHNGTDMRAIVSAIDNGILDAQAAVIISNNSTAPALEFAEEKGIESFHISQKTVGSVEQADREIAEILEDAGVDVVVMCGYMKKVGPQTLAAFPGRIMNVHPALLPDLKGHWGDAIYDEVITRRLAQPQNPRNSWTGVTIHWVDEEYDHGEHISQAGVKVTDDDTVMSLKNRVQGLEKIMYIQVLQDIAAGNIVLPKKPERVRK